MHELSKQECSDLRPFVELTVTTGILPKEMLEKIDANRLTKSDLTRIQKKIDYVIGGVTLNPQPDTERFVLQNMMVAAKAHAALIRIRLYDWK